MVQEMSVMQIARQCGTCARYLDNVLAAPLSGSGRRERGVRASKPGIQGPQKSMAWWEKPGESDTGGCCTATWNDRLNASNRCRRV